MGRVWSLCVEGVGVSLGWWPYLSKGEIFRLWEASGGPLQHPLRISTGFRSGGSRARHWCFWVLVPAPEERVPIPPPILRLNLPQQGALGLLLSPAAAPQCQPGWPSWEGEAERPNGTGVPSPRDQPGWLEEPPPLSLRCQVPVHFCSCLSEMHALHTIGTWDMTCLLNGGQNLSFEF